MKSIRGVSVGAFNRLILVYDANLLNTLKKASTNDL